MSKIELRPGLGGNMNVILLREKDVWIELNIRLKDKIGKKIELNMFAENNNVYNCLTIEGYGFCDQC